MFRGRPRTIQISSFYICIWRSCLRSSDALTCQYVRMKELTRSETDLDKSSVCNLPLSFFFFCISLSNETAESRLQTWFYFRVRTILTSMQGVSALRRMQMFLSITPGCIKGGNSNNFIFFKSWIFPTKYNIFIALYTGFLLYIFTLHWRSHTSHKFYVTSSIILNCEGQSSETEILVQ